VDLSEKPFDVFISHSTQDGQAASAIKQHLQASGLKCWKAPDDINPGESWPSAIGRALGSCRTMVLVWSSNSLASKEVSKELTLAMRNGLTVIPFRIEDVQPTTEWDYHLANTHWMDAFPGDLGPFVDRLASRIHGIMGSRAPAEIPAPVVVQKPITPVDRSKSRLAAVLLTLGAVVAAAVGTAWFFSRSAANKTPAETAAPAAEQKSAELDALRRQAEQAEKEKAEAQREAAEKEAESLRQIAQRAEAEKQVALERASQAEEAARSAQAAKVSPASAPPAAAADNNAARGGARPLRGTISDPDGYTNIRRGPGTKKPDGSEMPIVGRIVIGEVFDYFPDDSNWWRVRTSDGKQGYVHNSRIVPTAEFPASGF